MISCVSFNLCCPSFMVTHICVCSERYVAVPLNERGNVAVWKTENPLVKPAILVGHHKIVTALDLSYGSWNHYLCTCSSDNIIIWNLSDNDGNPTKGKVVHSHMEQPLFCRFSADTSKIAFSFPCGMWIFDLKENSWLISIEESYFTIFDFNMKDGIILGIKETSLKSWDLKENHVTSKLNIAQGIPTALCIHGESGKFIIGTSCGHLNIYGENYNLVRNIQVWKLNNQQKCGSNDEGSCKDYSHDSFPIFSIEIFKEIEDSTIENETYLHEVLYVLVATSTCLFILNINNEDLVFYKDFNSNFDKEELDSSIGLVRFANITCCSGNSLALISVIPVMSETLILIKLLLKEIIVSYHNKLKECVTSKLEKRNENCLQEPFLTFLNSVSEKNEKSLLTSKVQICLENKGLKKSTSKLNLPVTFHSKIKSSGYGKLHKPVVLFQPKILDTHKSTNEFRLPLKSEKNCSSSDKSILKHYGDTPVFEQFKVLDQIECFENPVVLSLQMSVDGKYASYTSSEGSIHILKLPKKKIRMFHTINAHKGQVHAAKWSHSEKLLVSGGKDKTVKVWNLERQQPLLTIGYHKDTITGVAKNKFIFEDPVEQVQFFYLDHFILAAAGDKVYLFDHTINIEKSGIKRVHHTLLIHQLCMTYS